MYFSTPPPPPRTNVPYTSSSLFWLPWWNLVAVQIMNFQQPSLISSLLSPSNLKHYPMEITQTWRTFLVANMFRSEVAGLLGCYALWSFPLLWRYCRLSLQCYDSVTIHNPEKYGGTSLRNVGKKLPNNTAEQPKKYLVSQSSLGVKLKSLFSDC